MRKITSLLMLFFAFVGIMNAEQLVNNGVYTLGVDIPVTAGELASGDEALLGTPKRGYLSYGKKGDTTYDVPVLSDIPWKDHKVRSADALENGKNWYVVSTDGGATYYFYNIGAGKFMARGEGNSVTFRDTPYRWIVQNNPGNTAYKNIGDSNTDDYWVSGGCGRNPGEQVVMDANENDGGSLYTFSEVTEGTFDDVKATVDAIINATVIYVYKYNGNEVRRSEPVKHIAGEPYNAPAIDDVDFVTFTQPEGAVAPGNQEVDVNCSHTLPFELSTSFDAAKWYAMTIRDDGPTFLQYQAGTDYIKANVDELKIDNNQSNAYMWAFLGNPFDGIKIINKAAGEGKVLSSPTAPTGEKNAGELARMVDESTATGNTTWIIKATTHNAITSDAFYIVHPTNTNYAFNRQSYNSVNTLCYWTGRDTGSSVQVFDLSDNVQYENNDAALTNFWTKADTYPSTFNTNLPVYKYQRIFTAKENNLDLLVVFEGGSDRINTKGVDVVDASGNVVASKYHNGFCGGNVENNYYFVRNLVPGTTYLLRCFVTHDVDGDGLNQTKGKIYIGDASTASEDEVNTFATTLQTNVASKQDWGGTTYGYFTQESVDAMMAAYEAVDATKNATTISTLIDKSNSLQCILPQPGKFYRLKGKKSGSYITGENADGVALASGKFAMAAYNENTWNDAVVFYLTEDGKLLNYRTGRYIDATHSVGGVGQANVITFKPSEGGHLGYLTLMADGHNATSKYLVDDNTELDRQSSYGQNACDWQIEDVTWLPVPMNTTAGYTTLYSPVALKCGDRVNAYTAGDINGGSLTLNPIDSEVIPANTPVILEYIQGETRNCVFLEITESTAEPIASALEGTYADTYIAAEENTDYYVLSMQNDVVGLYKAMINVNTDTSNDLTEGEGENAVTTPVYDSFLNNGFKVYLPVVNESGETTSQVLRFNFGGETTAIESVLNNGVDANAPIYDLSGRRVMNAVKGGIYIQNGKKFIVK